jgi:hypothetical protein
VRIEAHGLFQPVSAILSARGSVTLLSAYVLVRATAPGHVGDAVVDDAVDHERRVVVRRRMAGLEAPPWSIATSTSTEPGFMQPSISRVTSLGAAAPGTSTAPITEVRLAHRIGEVGLVGEAGLGAAFEVDAVPLEHFGIAVEDVTSAPSPTAICAALKPTTPPPITTTTPGITPGTPPSSTPRPPCAFSSAVAPA